MGVWPTMRTEPDSSLYARLARNLQQCFTAARVRQYELAMLPLLKVIALTEVWRTVVIGSTRDGVCERQARCSYMECLWGS